MKHNGIMIRINLLEGYSQKVNEFLQDEDYECKFVIRHEGKHKDNPHLHIAILSKITIQTMRARLKKVLECQGNKSYSMKKWDADKKFIQYCLHECDDMEDVRRTVLVNDKFGNIWWDDSELEHLMKASKIIQDNIKANSPHKIMIEVYHTIDWEECRGDRDIFKFIMRAYIERGDYLPNKYQMDRYMNYIKVMRAQILDSQTQDGNHQERFLDDLYENYYLR